MTAAATQEHLSGLVQQVVETLLSEQPDSLDGPVRIHAAFELADRAHAGQKRATGEPYIIHPIAVAQTCAEIGMDVDTIIAALCHDVVEDTTVTVEELTAALGAEPAYIVDGVTKLKAVSNATKDNANAASLRKLLVAATADPRVLVLKIADRLHNASTLAPLSEAKRRRIAQETLHVYAPLAHRLGMNEVAAALEDYSFAALEPELFNELSDRIDATAPNRDEKLERIHTAAVTALHAANIDATVTGRQKHVYSTYRKTVVRKQSFDQIADLIGIRVIVPTVHDCYAALGVLHNHFNPVPGRFRDYVAQPRFGHYQSLHTTLNVDGLSTEVQIRTWDMHAAAEQGIAAHWRYKEQQLTEAEPNTPRTVNLPWLQNLLAAGAADEATPEEFLNSVRDDLGADEVVVFTPKGKPLALPDGATALDAAYAVHTEIGNHAVEVRINGHLVPVSTRLRPGDQVHILTDNDTVPTEAWLDVATTGRARHAIRTALKTQRRANQQTGSEALGRAVRQTGVGRGWRQVVDLDVVAANLRLKDAAELLESIADDTLPAREAATVIRSMVAPPVPGERACALVTPSGTMIETASVHVVGRDDLIATSGTCCVPTTGGEVIGVTDEDGVVTLHAWDCLTLAHAETPLVDVDLTPAEVTQQAVVHLAGVNRATLLAEVLNAACQTRTQVVAVSMVVNDAAVMKAELTLEAVNPQALVNAVDSIAEVNDIYLVQVQGDS